jgi:hypothetical protein
MPDDLNIRRPQDPTKININEEWEVRYWTQKWSISREQLIQAVRQVGVQTARMAQYLGKQM